MNIVKKDKVYFFRGYVPKRLLTLLKQKTFNKSLKTKNKNKAIIKAKPLAIKFKHLMKELELMIENNSDIYTFLDKFIKKTLKNRETSLYNTPFTELDELFNNGYFAEKVDFFQHIVSTNDFSIINEYINEALTDYGKEVNNSDLYTIQQYIANKLLKQEIYIRENVKNGYYNVKPQQENTKAKDHINNTTQILQQDTTKPRQTNNLEYYISEYLESVLTELSTSIEAISLRSTSLKSLLFEFGNVDVASITLKELKTYRDRLQELPNKSLAKDNKLYKSSKSLIDIINTHKKNNYTQSVISDSTINKYISVVKNFFRYLNDNEYIIKDISQGLKPIKSSMGKASKKAFEFSNNELEMIFKSPFYTTKLEDNINKKIEKVFAPIIALYSGLRLNELSSLYVEDIKIKNGIYYFEINNEKDKTVKNETSIRKIPIHEKIIESGFLDYVDSLHREEGLRIWGNLTAKIKDKKNKQVTYSSNTSSWFGRFKKLLGFPPRKKVFHSFRHNALNNLKQHRVATEEIAQIAGHSNNNITIDRYGEAYSVESLAPLINEIHYDVSALNKLIPRLEVLIKQRISKG